MKKNKKNYMASFERVCKDEDKNSYKLSKVQFISLDDEQLEKRCKKALKVYDITDYSKKRPGKVICFLENRRDNTQVLTIASNGVTVKKGRISFGKYTARDYVCDIFENVREIVFENLDTSECGSMALMFNYLTRLEKVDLSTLDTSNVAFMDNMFAGCKLLKKIDLRGFDTHKVCDMQYMFYGCESLEKVFLDNFNTCKVKRMNAMFGNCPKLKRLDLKSFQTPKLVNMEDMFDGCISLEYLDISGFTFEKMRMKRGSIPYTFRGLPDTIKILVKDERAKKKVLSDLKKEKGESREDFIASLETRYKGIEKVLVQDGMDLFIQDGFKHSIPRWTDKNFVIMNKEETDSH